MLKIQCRCGHRIAVPQEYEGRRIKCPKCKGPLQVPLGSAPAVAVGGGHGPRRAAGAAPEGTAAGSLSQIPTRDHIRHARAKRHALERHRKSHNTTVTIIAAVMCLLGLGLMAIIGANNRPDDPPAPPNGGQAATTGAVDLRPIATSKGAGADGDGGGAKVSDEPQGKVMVAGIGEVQPVTVVRTFDAASGVTTVQSKPSPVSVGGRILTMTVTLMHDGKDALTATQMSAQLRLKGDFTGLAAGADTDDPLLLLTVDDRDYSFTPTNRTGGDARIGENAPEVLPNMVEFTLERLALVALARGATVRGTLGPTSFTFAPEQLAMFKTFVPEPAKISPAPPKQEKPTDEEMKDDDQVGDEPKEKQPEENE